MAYPAPGGWRVAGMIIKNDLPSGLNCGLMLGLPEPS